MSVRHNIKGRSKFGPAFVQLYCFMLDSDAWSSLTANARAVYLEVARRYNGHNNGFIALSVRDAAVRCRINKDTAKRALDELQALGFIECAVPGGFSLKVRHASEWRLTVARCDRTGAKASKTFMRWKPEPSLEKKKAVPK